MITRLRRRHRWTWWVLAALAPAIGVLAWTTRRAPVVMDALPAVLRSETSGGTHP